MQKEQNKHGYHLLLHLLTQNKNVFIQKSAAICCIIPNQSLCVASVFFAYIRCVLFMIQMCIKNQRSHQRAKKTSLKKNRLN